MNMNIFSLILLFAIHCAHATGSWSPCSDLDKVRSDIASIDDDLRTLFTSESINIESTDTITVSSANCQVVNGINYAVTTNFGVITYHVAPSASATPDTLSYVGSTSRITGGYSDYTDLSQVSTELDKVRSDIHSLLIANSMDVADDDNIVVLSAQSQVVAGTNFMVHINIGSYTNVILSYFIALPSTDADQIPSNLQLIDAGMKRVGSYSDIADLGEVQSQITSIDDELRDLLSNEGLDIGQNDTISVVSAQSQIVAGTNYKVTINAGSYSDVIISYFVGLAEVIPPPITDLKVLDLGQGGGDILLGGWDAVTSDDELDEIRVTVASMADQLISLLQSADMDIVDSAQIIVQSAQSQVVAGTNYRVNVAVGAYIDVIIQYFMGIPLLIMGAPVTYPLNLQLIDMGSERAVTSSVGSYSEISDLSAVKTTISTIESDIRSLLVSEGLTVGDSDTISVVSAQSQVVAGTNYMVTLNVGLMEGVIVEYFVGLPVNDPQQTPSNLQLIDLGIGGVDNLGSYQAVSDLDAVDEQVQGIKNEIIALLQDGNLSVDDDADIVVLSAEYQVVAGTNYKITMNVGYYSNVIISYFVALSAQTPTDLKLIDNGEMLTGYSFGSYSDISDLSAVESQITNMDDELRTLLVSEGFTVGDSDEISIVSAESQVVAGTNYHVTINIGAAQQAMIAYFVGLNDATPTDLKVIMKLQLDTDTNASMGSYESVSDLDAVKETVGGIENDIISLLQQNNLDVDDDAIIMVTSAQSQVVAGTNYAVTMAIGQYKDVIVGYFVPLPSSDADQTPTNVHLIDTGYSRMDSSVGSYAEVSDLSSVKTAVSSIESDIRSLLVTEGLTVEDDDEISVVSAESQVVAGTNYRVTIDVGSLLEDVIISYFVDLPVNDAEQTPLNLKVIDLGTSITLVDTPSEIETTASSDSSDSSSLNDEEDSVNNIMTTIHRNDWIIFGCVLVSVAVAICLLCVAIKKKQKKRTAGNELYASLNHDDAIDETL